MLQAVDEAGKHLPSKLALPKGGPETPLPYGGEEPQEGTPAVPKALLLLCPTLDTELRTTARVAVTSLQGDPGCLLRVLWARLSGAHQPRQVGG